MKHCPKCKTSKPLEKFGKDRTSKDGLQYACKSCRCMSNRQTDRSYRERNPERVLKKQRLRRARKVGVPSDTFTYAMLRARDGDDCHLCGESIDFDAKWGTSNDWYRSVDHAWPISLGGWDTFDNCRSVHLSCNTRRGNRVTDSDRLRWAAYLSSKEVAYRFDESFNPVVV